MTAKAGKYLTFELCGHMYAISIDKVSSILNDRSNISPVPEFPDYGKGAISLYDKVIPVIDPRIRMNLPGAGTAKTGCLIIVNIGDTTAGGGGSPENSEEKLMGLMADKINTIVDFNEGGLCPAPRLTATTSGYVIGVYKASTAIIMIIEPKLLLTEDMTKAMDEFNESHSGAK